ncbi:MAG: hypothetical protein ACJARP_000589 [Vicingaceae bacterium]|jgi:hypothetical protein
MKKLASFIFLLATVSTSFAQKNIEPQSNSWWMYFGNHKINEKYSLHTEYQFRRSDFAKNWQQSLARIGVDYHINKENAITVGYGWIVSYPNGKQPINTHATEHRIWQQFINQSNFGRIYLHHRYRLEQRFIEKAALNTDGNREVDGFSFRQRARYRLYVSIPITKKQMEDNTLFIGLYNEVFLGFGSGIGKNILDQNRLYTALGWRFSKQMNVQIGYLNQFVVKADGFRMERNHTLQAAVTYNLNFSKR